MTNSHRTVARFARLPLLLCTLASFAFLLAGCSRGGAPSATGGATWGDARLIQAADLAAALADTAAAKPLLVHVGVRVLYRAGAIPGSIYAGPGSDATGIEALLAVVKDQPKDRDIVLYCGCCPAVNCPNMKPAFAAMRDAGFTNVKALWIEKNFDTDWVNHGYPTEKPSL